MVAPLYSKNGFDFYRLHELESKYVNEAAELLSDEWSARSAEGRIRILQASSDALPIHFLVLEKALPIGHVKLCRCLGDSVAFYAESVVVAKTRRGKGLGKLMTRI